MRGSNHDWQLELTAIIFIDNNLKNKQKAKINFKQLTENHSSKPKVIEKP